MTLKVDAKFNGKLSRGLKIEIRNLVNIDVNSRKPENLDFDGLLLFNVLQVLGEKAQKNYVS